ncbi:hypothetical protein KDA_01680 [Dictyobacter alpinus]|uniref:Polyprenyl synthetase n=1 Tax=Dictyobacter alpinus TaxID=2014873 RepID=A0A402B007_9CHLR|nr:polyprenyl synthetase family protein [Dictyobacter alpinus]GCE24684.1 hypothetical protein KDA_01680 [Dictyobacter alpinus]
MSNQTDSILQPFALQQGILLQRLDVLLSSLDVNLKADVVQAFQDPEQLLSDDDWKNGIGWYATICLLFPFLITQCIEPEIDTDIAEKVAVAITCFTVALGLLYTIEEKDQTAIVQRLGSARVLNVSTALLALAQRSILALSSNMIASAQLVKLLLLMQATILEIQNGQRLTLLNEQKVFIEIEHSESLEQVTLRGGILMRLVGQLGAICANADKGLDEQFALLGYLYGVALQLKNASAQQADTERNLLPAKNTLVKMLVLEQRTTIGSASTAEPTADELQMAVSVIKNAHSIYQQYIQEVLQKIQERLPLTTTLQQFLNSAR